MRARALLTTLLFALTTTATLTVAASAPAKASGAGDVTELVNGARAAAGLTTLVPDARLAGVAQAWAEQMATRGSLDHNPSTSTQIPAGWSAWGENVAWSTEASPGGLHANLMASAGHRANILSATFTAVGVGYATDAAGGTYVAEVFAAYAPGAPAPSRTVPPGTTDPAAPSRAQGRPGPTTTRSPAGLVAGARGPEVLALQERLRVHGQEVVADGVYGQATTTAVTAFQVAHGLVADGVAGPATTASLALAPAVPEAAAEPRVPQAVELPGPVEVAEPAADTAGTPRAGGDRAADQTPGRAASSGSTSLRPAPVAPDAQAVPAYGWVVAGLALLAAASLSVVGARRRSRQVRRPPQE